MKKPVSIKEVEKKHGVAFNARSNMKLETWLKREGLPSLANALKIIEKK